jgi:hypothetical protein
MIIWASRFAHFVRSRRAIRGSLRSYLRALRALGTRRWRAASIPLAQYAPKARINANNGFRFVFYFVVFLSFLSPKIEFYCSRDRACPVSTLGAKNVKKRSTHYLHYYLVEAQNMY